MRFFLSLLTYLPWTSLRLKCDGQLSCLETKLLFKKTSLDVKNKCHLHLNADSLPQGPLGPQGPIGYPGPRGVKVPFLCFWPTSHQIHPCCHVNHHWSEL